jgi:hypothetical protein
MFVATSGFQDVSIPPTEQALHSVTNCLRGVFVRPFGGVTTHLSRCRIAAFQVFCNCPFLKEEPPSSSKFAFQQAAFRVFQCHQRNKSFKRPRMVSVASSYVHFWRRYDMPIFKSFSNVLSARGRLLFYRALYDNKRLSGHSNALAELRHAAFQVFFKRPFRKRAPPSLLRFARQKAAFNTVQCHQPNKHFNRR